MIGSELMGKADPAPALVAPCAGLLKGPLTENIKWSKIETLRFSNKKLSFAVSRTSLLYTRENNENEE